MSLATQPRPRTRSIACGALQLLLSLGLSSLSAQWVQTSGPKAGLNPHAVAFSPTSMFVANDEGVFRSPDSGKSWTPTSDGTITGLIGVSSLLATRGIVLAGSFAQGIYRSANDGRSWTPISSAFENTIVYSLAANATAIFAGTDRGVFRSSDDGISWTQSKSGLSDTVVTSLIAGSDALIAGTFSAPFRSTDGGRTWSKMRSLGDTTSNCFALLAAGKEFFISTAYGTFRSVNSGGSWVRAEDGLGRTAITSIVAAGPDLFASVDYNGICRSSDHGATWQSSSEPFLINPVNFVAANGGSLYAGTLGDGLYRSTTTNPGSWTRVESRGLPYHWVENVASFGNRIYAALGDYAPPLESVDAGSTWRSGGGAWPAQSGALFEVWKGTMYALDRQGRLFSKADVGSPWRILISEPLSQSIIPNKLYFAAGDTNFFMTTIGAVYRSALRGTRWDSAGSLPRGSMIRCLAVCGRHVVVGLVGGIYLSSDVGRSWTESATDRTIGGVAGLRFQDSVLYAAGIGGMMRSDDFGNTWRLVNNGIVGTPTGAVTAGAGALFTVTDRGVFYSQDAGGTWIAASTGLGKAQVNSLIVDQSRLIAATDSGVWVRPISELIPTTSITNPPARPEFGPSPYKPGPRALFPLGSRWLDALGRYRD